MYTVIETLALIIIIASLIKIIVLLINPKAYLGFAKGVWKNPKVVKTISFILAIVVLYHLLGAGITILQILAVTAFVALIMVMGMASEVTPLLKKYETQIKNGTLWKEFWFYTLIWIVLLLWGAKELFM